MDPTFDPPGPHDYLDKLTGPAVSADALGQVDVVLVSHDQHPDNLDNAGRRLAEAAPLIVTNPGAAGRFGPPAVGLQPWQSYYLPGGPGRLRRKPFRPCTVRPTGCATWRATSTARSPVSCCTGPACRPSISAATTPR